MLSVWRILPNSSYGDDKEKKNAPSTSPAPIKKNNQLVDTTNIPNNKELSIEATKETGTIKKEDNNPEQSEKRKEVNCLNEECQGKHLLKDCPKTTEDRKKKIFKDFYATNKSRPTVSAIKSSIQYEMSDGKFSGMLEGSVTVVINGD